MAIDKVGAIALEPSGRARFGEVLEGVKGSVRRPGPRVATEGTPPPAPAERMEALRGTCEAQGVGRAGAGASAVEVLDRVSKAQKRLDHILELAQSGRSFSPAELLAFQAQVYRASQELEFAGKVVEKATSGVKQVLQTQV